MAVSECPEVITVSDCIDIGRIDIAIRIMDGAGRPVMLHLSDAEKDGLREDWRRYHPLNRPRTAAPAAP